MKVDLLVFDKTGKAVASVLLQNTGLSCNRFFEVTQHK